MKSNGDNQTGNGATAQAADGQDPSDLLGSVRGHDCHESVPCPVEQIAWQYLSPEKRMRRWTETIEIVDLGRSKREITIDFSLPDGDASRRWMLPTAYLDKWPVAPDLEVVDATGTSVSVPTKRENMAITAQALDGLAGAGLISFEDDTLRSLCHQVIFRANFEARVARLVAEERMGSEEGLGSGGTLLRLLLRSLEDQFLLWVPVVGEPGCDQQISIRRRQELARNVILAPKRVMEDRTVDTAAGPVGVNFFGSTGPRRINFEAALSRFLRLFGLAPFEYAHETSEARRFASFHLRVTAPEGLVVRDVGLRVPRDGTEQMDPPPLTEAPTSEEGFSHRGREGDLAHFHCARAQNPTVISAFATLGIRGGLTSLWAGAAVFTTLLLWAVHRLAPADLAAAGTLEATVAILLIGPALAAAWAIQADRGDLLESTLGGARVCLLASSMLSVTVAFSLAGFRPFHWSNETAVEVYASLSYGFAALVVVGWAATLSPCWLLYREVFTTARRNYGILFLIAGLAGAVCVHSELPVRLVGLALLGTGLAMAVIAAHPGRAAGASNSGPPVAALGALGTLLAAGWFLGFYENLFSRETLRIAVLAVEATVMAIAAIQWYRKG
jgi:hypothetical protein